MRSTRWYVFRLSSNRCSTCEDLRRLHARSEAALRNARNLYRAAVKGDIDSVALRNLEELKQTSAARKLICNAIQGKPMGLLPRQSCVTGLGRPV
jgi:hypothetical protein